ERTVIPASVQAAVDLARRENESAALGERNELVHRHHDFVLRADGRGESAPVYSEADAGAAAEWPPAPGRRIGRLSPASRTQFEPGHWSFAPFRRIMLSSLPHVGAVRRRRNRGF